MRYPSTVGKCRSLLPFFKLANSFQILPQRCHLSGQLDAIVSGRCRGILANEASWTRASNVVCARATTRGHVDVSSQRLFFFPAISVSTSKPSLTRHRLDEKVSENVFIVISKIGSLNSWEASYFRRHLREGVRAQDVASSYMASYFSA